MRESVEALAWLRELGAEIAVVCPAFPANGRTVYQGHLFVGDRLLSESSMAQHPLTPMADPDLVRFLGRQARLSCATPACGGELPSAYDSSAGR